MRLHVIKHTSFEGPGAIATWARERGYEMETTEVEQGQSLPSPRDFDALILMGGPMSVNDEDSYAWLRPEKALVRLAALAAVRVSGSAVKAKAAGASGPTPAWSCPTGSPPRTWIVSRPRSIGATWRSSWNAPGR